MSEASNFPKEASLVIIGAGIVGCAAAHFLSKLGWKDIVVVDQGRRPFFGGSSTHAPGGMFQTNPSKLMCEMAQFGTKFYRSLEHDGKKGAELVGGIEFASTPERMLELKRRCVIGKSWGLNGEVLTAKECADKVPHLDPNTILGGYYVPDDGVGRPVVCVQALAKEAESRGVSFYDCVDVLDIETKNKHVEAVVTSKGRIACAKILCCAGFWGPIIGKMVGQAIPLQPMEHQYVKTEALKGYADIADKEISYPLLRDQDYAAYFRQHNQEFGIGNYFHRPIPIRAEDILHPSKAKVMPSVTEFTDPDFVALYKRTKELFPFLEKENPKFSYKINGVFSFTPDGSSYLGESMKTRGFWVAEAIWYLHAAGFAKAIAEWMDAGEPQQDLHEADVNRLYDHAGAPKYVVNRGSEQYRVVYDINHPKRQGNLSRNIARSPYFERQRDLGAKFFDTLGFERAHWYESNARLLDLNFAVRKPWAGANWSPIEAVESHYTRNFAGMYDLSAFQIFEVSGPSALDFLQHSSCSNMDTKPGKITYSHFLTDKGGIKSDITVARMEEDVFWVMSGVGSAGHDLAMLKTRNDGRTGVNIRSIGAEYGTIGIWGPKAKDIVAPMCDISLEYEDFKFFQWRAAYIEEIPVYLLRLSYVGESGWEIYTKSYYAAALWEKLEAAGAGHNLIPCGGGAFDSLRIEKGYRSWGGDMAQNENPYEAGTDFVINWKKGDFIGRTALEKVKEQGISIRLCTFIMDDPSVILLGSETAYDESGRRIGYVTSANYSYSLNQSVGYAYLDKSHMAKGSVVYFDYLGIRHKATVADDVLYDREYVKIRA